MEGKNVVYLVAIIVTCLFVVLVLAYIPNVNNIFQNADHSSKLIKNIENDINDINPNIPVVVNQVNPVVNKAVEPTKKMNELSKLSSQISQKINTNSGKSGRDPAIMMENLKALVVKKYDGVNEHQIDNSIPMMDFVVSKLPIITDRGKDGVKDINYQLSYYFGNFSGDLEPISNNTVFQTSLAGSGYAKIEFRYSDDPRKEERERMLEQSNHPSQLEYIKENYSKKTILEQSVSFFMWDVKFNNLLRMPQKLTIWNEFSKDIFPCKLTDNSFVHLGSSYSVDYSCERLPNFNDYGGSLKFIFN